ncbi:hypothetical protein PXW85_27125, partial [Klebsiella pneumoniae]|nr:hypothetical protein [Klebsiella pneumoniae]
STVNFNVTGTIEAPSCEVAVEPSNSIDLGTVSSQTFSGHAGALIGDNIYATSVQGIGIRVKVWLNISGEYGDDTDDFSPDS